MTESTTSTRGTTASNHGVITSVRASVVDVRFEDSLPPIYSLLRAGRDGRVTIEVLMQLDEHHVRGIALTPTQFRTRLSGRRTKLKTLSPTKEMQPGFDPAIL